MPSIDEKIDDWSDSQTSLPFYPSMRFVDGGLALGRGTYIARFARGTKSSQSLDLDGHEACILALLAAAHDRHVSHRAIETIRRAAEIWQTGDKALAQIRLVYVGLPPIDERGAYRLDLAVDLLDKGFSPRRLLRELGFQSTLRELEKFDPYQPRMPAGSGRESGRWTLGYNGAGSAPANPSRHETFVQRVDVKIVGATQSDANPDYLVPGAQYAQNPNQPIITQDALNHIKTNHWFDSQVPYRGKFSPEYSDDEEIKKTDQ
ncbi:MAG: hypothetical protein ACLPID_13860 [Beijerinckiaceae bacterium]